MRNPSMPVFRPVIDNTEESVVSIPGGRRVGSIPACTPNHADRVSLQLATRQAGVADRQLLVGDLSPGSRVVATLTRVDDLFSAIFIIDIPA
jgi:hypothetical protein